MKKCLVIMLSVLAFSCSSNAINSASKKTDLKSPCAGCEDRILPNGNKEYLV